MLTSQGKVLRISSFNKVCGRGSTGSENALSMAMVYIGWSVYYSCVAEEKTWTNTYPASSSLFLVISYFPLPFVFWGEISPSEFSGIPESIYQFWKKWHIERLLGCKWYFSMAAENSLARYPFVHLLWRCFWLPFMQVSSWCQ